MKRKLSTFRYSNNKNGSLLIGVLMILVIVSLLGMSLLSVASSNFKITAVERDFQAVYYIAEAGINESIYEIGKKVDELSDEPLNHDEFFKELQDYMDSKIDYSTLDEFEETFGEKPLATRTVVNKGSKDENTESYTQRVTSYEVSSIGEIGNLKRTVSSSICIVHRIDIDSGGHHPAFDYVLYSPEPLSLSNQSKIDGSIYSKDIVLKSSGTEVNGDVISETYVDIRGNHDHPKIEGNVYALNGYVNVSTGGNATVEGEVHANGDITIGSSGTVENNVYSTGNVLLKSARAKILGDLHAEGDVELQSGTFIGGNAYLDGDLKLLNSNSRIQGNVFAGNNISMQNDTTIEGNSQAGGPINEHDGANKNTPISPNNRPIKPKFPAVDKITPPNLSAFTPDKEKHITVPSNSTNYIIEPGEYGNLTINGTSTITFKPGNYVFNSINGAAWDQSLRLDLSGDSINIFVKEHIKFSGRLAVDISQDGYNYRNIDDILNEDPDLLMELAGKLYWESHSNFEVGNDTTILGSILVEKNLKINNSVKLIGAYVTKNGEINIGNAPTFIYAPPTNSDAGGSGGSNNGNGQGQNTISPDARIQVSESIREK